MKLLTSLLFLFFSSLLPALPVDLSAPPGGLGPTSDQGAAVQWVEMAEIDFGSGLTLPLRMSFLTSRLDDEKDFGSGYWRTPLHDSRLMPKKDGRWPVLLPCGKVMSLFPKTDQKGVWATADGEWTARAKGANTLVSREDGWEMEFSARNHLIRLRNDTGRNILWTRDASGHLLSLAEFVNGKTLPPAYSAIRNAAGRVSSLKLTTTYGVKQWRYDYDAAARLQSIAFPDSSSVRIAYATRAEDGQPQIAITGRDTLTTTLTWHQDSRSLLSDGVWAYTITPQPGNNPLMTRIGPHGETEIQHDDELNHRSLFTSADGTQTIRQKIISGPAKGKLQSITRVVKQAVSKLATSNLKPETQVLYTATYDTRGLLETETDALGHKITHAYTLHGSSVHTGIKSHSLTSAKGSITTRSYDRNGNLTVTTNAVGHTTRFEYDTQNRPHKIFGPDGTLIESFTYTAPGGIATRTDALGATTTYYYDANGNRKTITDALGNITKHEFDLRGNLTATTDALGHTTRYEYDEGGRLIASILPEVGATEVRVQKTSGAAARLQPGTENREPRTTFAYDLASRRIRTITPDGTVTEATTYDALGRITSRTDALGNLTKYEYDVKKGSTGCLSCSASALPTRIISPSGRITERSYDADRHLLSETIAAGTQAAATTVHVYDLAGNRLSTTDALGRTTRYEYNVANQPIKIIHPDKKEKTFAYNALGQMIAETNELGHTTKREYDAYNNLIATTTPEGHTTRTVYGDADAPVRSSNPGEVANPKTLSPLLSALRSSGFAALHRPTATISPSGITTAIHYDLLGRRLSVTKAPGTPEAATTTYQYDAVGNEIASLSPTDQKTTHTYDARRRRVTTTDAIGRTWTFGYNDNAGPSGAPPCCGADPTARSRATATIHPDGTRDEKLYNAIGQLIETRDANVTTKAGQKSELYGIRYAYDPDGRLIDLTDARGSITKWRYDARGKLQAKTYPDGTTEIYEHDAAGQLVSRTRPDGTVATHTYSARGKLLSVQWSDGKTENSTFTYDAAGNLTLAENKSAIIKRSYNTSGKMAKEVQSIHYATLLPPSSTPQAPRPLTAEVGYAYTPDGQLAQLTYPDATTVSYRYNTRGELAEVLDSMPQALGSEPVPASYTRNPDGKIISLAMPNGTVTYKSYDAVGRLMEIRHVAPDKTVLFSETSRYDNRNRRTARIHEDGTTDLFAYDPAGQVTAAAYGQAQSVAAVPAAPKTENSEPITANASASFKPSQTFAYDPAGNRQSFQDLDGSKTEYSANEANQYTEITSASESTKSVKSVDEPRYDKLGNLLIDDTHTYTWDADIHLLSVTTQSIVASNAPLTANRPPTTESFRYDALHRRVVRHESATNTTTLFTHDGWNVIAEFSTSPNLPISKSHGIPAQSLRLVWGEDLSGSLQGAGGIGGLLSTKNQEQKDTSFFHYDSNGNTTRLSDIQGRESAHYSYDAFGRTIMAQGAAAQINRYRFSTKSIELSSGLAYYGFRYYSPELGRWPSRDPIQERGGVYLYSFVENSGPNSHDRLGLAVPLLLAPVVAGGGGGAATGGGIWASICAFTGWAATTEGVVVIGGATAAVTLSGSSCQDQMKASCEAMAAVTEPDECWVESILPSSGGPGGQMCVIKCKSGITYVAPCGYDYNPGDEAPPLPPDQDPNGYPPPDPLPDKGC
jgi:RHS repeat-associated protein